MRQERLSTVLATVYTTPAEGQTRRVSNVFLCLHFCPVACSVL